MENQLLITAQDNGLTVIGLESTDEALNMLKKFEDIEIPEKEMNPERMLEVFQQYFVMYKKEGIGGGDIKFRDINNDGQITELDLVPIGYPTTPEIVYGFGFSFGAKDFDFSMFFQGLARESFWIDANATAPFIGQTQLLAAYADDYWSEENQNLYALWPRLTTSSTGKNNNQVRSTWFMRDGSFLRLKQVELGYSVPKNVLSKLYMTSCRFYITSTNPVLWSKFKLWDVEMGGNGLGYPIQKAFNVGVNFSF